MVWYAIATVCAFFVKGLCGFANTLVFTTMLSFENDNIQISPVELLLGYPTNAIMAWKERECISWRICAPLAGLVVAGRTWNEKLIKKLVIVMLMISGVALVVKGCW